LGNGVLEKLWEDTFFFEVLAKKKKTTTMEFWEKTMNKKNTTLGTLRALEKP